MKSHKKKDYQQRRKGLFMQEKQELAYIRYQGVGNCYLISLKELQIGIGIGKVSIINSKNLQIGNYDFGRTDPRRGICIGIGQRSEFETIAHQYRYR